MANAEYSMHETTVEATDFLQGFSSLLIELFFSTMFPLSPSRLTCLNVQLNLYDFFLGLFYRGVRFGSITKGIFGKGTV